MLIAPSTPGSATEVLIRTGAKDPIGDGTWAGTSTFAATKCTKSTGTIMGTTMASTRTTTTAMAKDTTTTTGMVTAMTRDTTMTTETVTAVGTIEVSRSQSTISQK